ncbi:MAG: hypothetical protein WCI01_02320 [Chlorobiaceae bacterium]
MKKTTFAGIVSICMVPALFWSTEGSAIPSWARKYNTSCYMCHSGMPQRNAVGEAFMNNGYRLPGGNDEAFTRQKNIRIGTADWDKKFPLAPVSGSLPQFDPLSVVLSGTMLNYKEATHNTLTNLTGAGKEFTIGVPTASLFYGASVGDNLTVFGQISGFGGNTIESDEDSKISTSLETSITHSIRAVWQFSPGFNFAIGNSFSPAGNTAWNGTGAGGVVNVNTVMPQPVTYAELNLTRGEVRGFSIVAGTSMGAKQTAAPGVVATKNAIDDILYVRGKLKLIGAGLLSGANGELGNSYNGLDNQLTVGAGLSYAKNNSSTLVKDPVTGITPVKGFTANFAGETLVYGGDIQGVYQDFLVGAAYSRDRDLKLDNFQVDAGYFIYPWLFAKVAYADIANATNYASLTKRVDTHQPTIKPSISAWISPNVSLTGTYTIFQKGKVAATNVTNQNVFALAVTAGF